MSLGQKPYVDFNWTHGYIDLYGPFWTSRFLHLGIIDGYFVFWTIYSLLGTYLGYKTINMIDYPCNYKRQYFLLGIVGTILSVSNMATHYTNVRYTAPLFFLLIIYDFVRRKQLLWATSLSFIFTAILFAVSPEVAISHAFACLILLFPWRPASAKIDHLLLFASLLLLFGLLFWIAFRLHILDYIFTAASGGASFPIIPAPHILFFFATVFLCFAYLTQRISQRTVHDNSIVLILFAIPMTAAALERCDPGHVGLNGGGFILAAFFYAASHRSLRLWYFAGLIISFYSFSTFACAYLSFHPLLTRSHSFDSPKSLNLSTIYQTARFYRSDPVFEAPFEYEPNRFRPYLSTQIDYGFYDGLVAVDGPRQIQAKIGELVEHPERPLLLDKDYSALCKLDPHFERVMLSVVFEFPYKARVAHTDSVVKPLCSYIEEHYFLAEPPARENYNYGLWLPRNGFESNQAAYQNDRKKEY